MTHVPETGARKMETIYGAGFWSVCHGYNCTRLGRVRDNIRVLARFKPGPPKVEPKKWDYKTKY